MSTPPSAPATALITEAMKRQYQEQGYFILENVVPQDTLAMLREQCAAAIAAKDRELSAAGQHTEGITHKGRRYFIANRYREWDDLHQFIYGPVMAAICRATLGDTAYLFNEQWVVKGADQGMKFAWHQDSGYVKHGDPATTHRPYLTCWTTLDDVDETNGTVYILPHEKAGTRDHIFDHTQEQGTNDLVGYSGDEPGIPVIVPAGSIACFSSYTFHRSGANHTDQMRRVYLTQYSATPIRRKDGDIWALAIPFLENGRVIYDHQADRAAEK